MGIGVDLVAFVADNKKEEGDEIVTIKRDDNLELISISYKGFYISFPELFFKTALKEIGFWMD